MSGRLIAILATCTAFGLTSPRAHAADDAAAEFQKTIQPLLEAHCYDCHADGINKGGVAFDGFPTQAELIGNHDLWWKVVKNVRAGLMPPPKKKPISEEDKRLLSQWVLRKALALDPADPDPGRVSLRRLNRNEYRNTIRELTGFDFRADEEFPPDDTGYGFDTIGDVLNVSPLLLEKYLQAAESIVDAAVPTVSRVVAERQYNGGEFHPEKGEGNGDRISFYKETAVGKTVKLDQAGDYRLHVALQVDGAFDFDPGRCKLTFKVDDEPLIEREFEWQDNKSFAFDFDRKWEPGERKLSFHLEPLTPPEKRKTSVDMRIKSIRLVGPMEKEHWVRPPRFERFFTQDAPADPAERRAYTRETLKRFATKAFRRPVDERSLDRLTAIAEEAYSQPETTFEKGVSRAMVAALASPRFLFRVENVQPGTAAHGRGLLDEYSLASRLSYFLWSSMPDEELFQLAERGELRQQLTAQVDRMLKDGRSKAFVENFTGQWLQARDIDGVSIDARSVLARDAGDERSSGKAFQERRKKIMELQAAIEVANKEDPKKADELRAQLQVLFKQRNNQRMSAELDEELRHAMRRETEMSFAYVVHDDRSVLELIDSDYTFLNERLAKHYGVPDVKGKEMRRVELPKDSPRGGVLTQGTVLAVTSNPTRTSPVKRGLFILENILGTPTPPPPPDIPALEESDKAVDGHEPTNREVLELHRAKPLCASCHNRMDPLGFALENFNAMGMFRESERKQKIDAAGKLITGEEFTTIQQLKKVLANERRQDFYRCLSEKLLTYAIGRGLEYYDTEAIDQIVDGLNKNEGRFSALLSGVIDSAPFQKRRTNDPTQTAERADAPEQRADTTGSRP